MSGDPNRDDLVVTYSGSSAVTATPGPVLSRSGTAIMGPLIPSFLNDNPTDPLAAALRVKELEKAGLHGFGNDAAPGRRAEIVRLAPALAAAPPGADTDSPAGRR